MLGGGIGEVDDVHVGVELQGPARTRSLVAGHHGRRLGPGGLRPFHLEAGYAEQLRQSVSNGSGLSGRAGDLDQLDRPLPDTLSLNGSSQPLNNLGCKFHLLVVSLSLG